MGPKSELWRFFSAEVAEESWICAVATACGSRPAQAVSAEALTSAMMFTHEQPSFDCGIIAQLTGGQGKVGLLPSAGKS
jgi:hypothetical protein